MRLTTDIWVSAWLRHVAGSGAMAVVVRRGAREAGAVAVKVNRLDTTFDLYLPAPQAVFDDARPAERLFCCVLEKAPEEDVEARLSREADFDSDLWIIEVEDRPGRAFVETAPVD